MFLMLLLSIYLWYLFNGPKRMYLSYGHNVMRWQAIHTHTTNHITSILLYVCTYIMGCFNIYIYSMFSVEHAPYL